MRRNKVSHTFLRRSKPKHEMMGRPQTPRRWRIAAILIYPLLFATMACSESKSEDDAAKAASTFAKAYFNYDFNEASKFCTDDSRRWLAFAASNIYEADIEVLRNMENGAEVDVTDVDCHDDSTATATVEVANYMQRDTIDKAGRVTDKGVFALTLLCKDGVWKVRMSGALRSEK